MIVAIDGPAGSGKTTVSRELAARLGFFYLDTGATYRALTYAVLEREIDLGNKEEIAILAASLDLELKDNRVYLSGRDISKEIRMPRIDKNISRVVAYPQVRKVMNLFQRNIAKGKNYVVEGRDITTVVFPDAEFKFYLDAEQETRAERRYKQLSKGGQSPDAQEVKEDLTKRDEADKNREVGSLKLTGGACYIDTTQLSVEETVVKLADFIKEKINKRQAL